MNLYEELAENLKSRIRGGVYVPGDRVPSVRRLSGQQRVSPATVVAAYRLLEVQGWLEARPQSGFYARLPETLPPAASQTCEEGGPCSVSITELAVRLSRHTHRADLVSLGTAVPHASLLPLKELKTSLSQVTRRHPDLGTSISFPPGEEALRVQIARRAAETGCAISPDDIIITSGCQEALNLSLRAVARAGDIVAIESPAFFGTLQAIESLGLKALEIPTDPATGISLPALELALDRWPVKAVMVVSNFSNPTGALMPDSHKQQLVRLLAARDIPLIEDDIYSDLSFDRERPRPAKAYDKTGNVMLCDSLSKTVAPGFRVGWVVPGRWKKTVEHLKFVNTMGTATLPQWVLADYLASGRYERHLAKVRRLAADNLARIQALVARHFPSGTRTTRPQGGFLLWVELPEGHDSMKLYDLALQAGISITPGPLASPQGKYRNCFRLVAALPWDHRVEAALVELGRLTTYCRDGHPTH